MDISLPSMDGYAVLDALRADETLRHTPVVALTAKAMKGDREEILGRGFDGYISKPIDAKALALTLSEFLHEA
jgi:CheY-like chemotaxis protein